MGKYFGTDGFRGNANTTLTVTQALNVGIFLGHHYSQNGKAQILVGKDTRLSSDMLENALAAGIAAGGCDAVLCGICPTPMVAYQVRHHHYACGAMISASHNPYGDNGIKLFNGNGEKCDPKLEEAIEAYLDGQTTVDLAVDDKIGSVINDGSLLDEYKQWLLDTVPLDKNDLTIVIDGANGSATMTAVDVLSQVCGTVIATHVEPNGTNINAQCGSTHPESLQKAVLANHADIGFAFDGDADRLMCVDHLGRMVTGDHMLYFLGKYLDHKGLLNDHCVVSTVMANLGFFHALNDANLVSVKTDVGDKYVYEQMINHQYDLGGEQSGHIIFRRDATTGDGLLTALHVLQVVTSANVPLATLADGVTIYPQELINVKVNDKHAVLQDPQVKQWIDDVDQRLQGSGRLLVRPSGTEPLVRVMAEAKTEEQCHALVSELSAKIQDKYGI